VFVFNNISMVHRCRWGKRRVSVSDELMQMARAVSLIVPLRAVSQIHAVMVVRAERVSAHSPGAIINKSSVVALWLGYFQQKLQRN
jgi:hypothetical protein